MQHTKMTPVRSPTRPRIVQIVTGDNEVAGVQRHAAWLSQSSAFEHHILVGAAPVFEDYLEKNKIPFRRFSNMFGGLSALQGLKPDLVHAHLGHALILGAAYKRALRKVPFLYTQHILYPRSSVAKGFQGFVRRVVLKEAYASLDALIAVSHAVELETRARGEHDNVRVIWNGVGMPWLAWPRTMQKLTEIPFRVLGLSRMEPEKRPVDFIEVAKRLDDPDIEIFVYGAGSLLEKMRAREEQALASCATRVRFMGYEPAIEDRITQAHILLHFGREEACPLSLIEVQRQGLPVVTYGQGGNVELVPPGNGFLVGEADFEAAARAVRHYAHDRKSLEKASEACRSFSKELSLEGNARQTDALYREILDLYCARNLDL
jgi:glycosyltransferase involved in cell wall biosynthesis